MSGWGVPSWPLRKPKRETGVSKCFKLVVYYGEKAKIFALQYSYEQEATYELVGTNATRGGI
eukprot:scaffold1867_cov122-Cylindrotheca_fusiformis.AAC.6